MSYLYYRVNTSSILDIGMREIIIETLRTEGYLEALCHEHQQFFDTYTNDIHCHSVRNVINNVIQEVFKSSKDDRNYFG